MNFTTFQQLRVGGNRERHGFTLIELLLVISIIAVLSSLALFVVRGATQDAKTAATQMRIRQIDSAIQQQMLNYEFRRVPVRLSDPVYGIGDRVVLQQVRNRIIADMIHVEMPGVWRWNYTAVRWEDDTLDNMPVDPGDDYAGVEQIPTTNADGGIFPSEQLESWLIDKLGPGNGATLVTALYERRSSVIYQLQTVAPPFHDTSESLAWILQNTEVDGVPSADSLGSRPFIDDPLVPYRLAVVDGFDDRFIFRLMYVDLVENPTDDTGEGEIDEGLETPEGSGMVPLADAIRFEDPSSATYRGWNIEDISFDNIRPQIISVNEQ